MHCCTVHLSLPPITSKLSSSCISAFRVLCTGTVSCCQLQFPYHSDGLLCSDAQVEIHDYFCPSQYFAGPAYDTPWYWSADSHHCNCHLDHIVFVCRHRAPKRGVWPYPICPAANFHSCEFHACRWYGSTVLLLARHQTKFWRCRSGLTPDSREFQGECGK